MVHRSCALATDGPPSGALRNRGECCWALPAGLVLGAPPAALRCFPWGPPKAPLRTSTSQNCEIRTRSDAGYEIGTAGLPPYFPCPRPGLPPVCRIRTLGQQRRKTLGFVSMTAISVWRWPRPCGPLQGTAASAFATGVSSAVPHRGVPIALWALGPAGAAPLFRFLEGRVRNMPKKTSRLGLRPSAPPIPGAAPPDLRLRFAQAIARETLMPLGGPPRGVLPIWPSQNSYMP